MECNKDEAVRAKEISEKKLLERDITGAKKFALKAQNLFPKLDGLSQFLEIIDIYVAQEKKINGEADYYGILGVDSSSDDETLKKQYRRMALSLHPDKNKSVGADGAFKMLSEAWSVLSDKDKRNAYNFRLTIRASNQMGSFGSSGPTYTPTTATNSQHVPTRPRTPVVTTVFGSQYNPASCRPTPGINSEDATAADSGYGPTRNPELTLRHQRTTSTPTQYIPAPRPLFPHQYIPARGKPTSSPHTLRTETFWTLCNRCRIQYQYQKIYLNQNLLCSHCCQPFLAKEIPAPNLNSHSSRPRSFPKPQQDMSEALGGSGNVPTSATRTPQAASCQPSRECPKRKQEEEVYMAGDGKATSKNGTTVSEKVEAAMTSNAASSCRSREKPVKRRRRDGHKGNSAKKGSQGTEGSRSGRKRPSANGRRNLGSEQKPWLVRELSQIEIRNMLMGKVKMEIIGRLNEWENEKSQSSQTKDSMNASLKNDPVNSLMVDQSRNGLYRDPKKTSLPQKSSTLEEKDDRDTNLDETVSMVVPDANFHNFDEDRIEESFAENHVWAAYDDDDGMPRYYALVHHVISRRPFNMQISWLNSKSSSEFGSLDWIGCGFTKTMGDFRVGKSVVSKRLNSFSHPVKWRKAAKGVIQIFPTKGEVWALYRNWSPDWNATTSDEIIHKYDLVVVLEDYNEDTGVSVAPLAKVAGFTSVFNQLLHYKDIQTILREEMFKFSHQVPFHRLNGLEAENAPKGCYELDPAALPLELLKVITDAEAAVQRDPESTHASEGVEDGKHVLTYSRRNKGRKTGRDVDQFQ